MIVLHKKHLFKYLFLILLTSIISILFISCGTVTGLNSIALIDSNPQGAEVILNDRPMGRTPTKITMKNNKGYMLTLRHSGYSKDYKKYIDSYISREAIISDIFLTGCTGLIVDYFTGGFYKHKELNNQTLLFDFNTEVETAISLPAPQNYQDR